MSPRGGARRGRGSAAISSPYAPGELGDRPGPARKFRICKQGGGRLTAPKRPAEALESATRSPGEFTARAGAERLLAYLPPVRAVSLFGCSATKPATPRRQEERARSGGWRALDRVRGRSPLVVGGCSPGSWRSWRAGESRPRRCRLRRGFDSRAVGEARRGSRIAYFATYPRQVPRLLRTCLRPPVSWISAARRRLSTPAAETGAVLPLLFARLPPWGGSGSPSRRLPARGC